MLTYLISLLVHGLGMYQSVKLQRFSEPNWDTITALVIPAAYHSTKVTSGDSGGALAPIFNRFSDPDITDGLLVISRGTAILLLGVYVTYLFFQVIRKSSYSFFWFTFEFKAQNPSRFLRVQGPGRGRRTDNERYCCCVWVCCETGMLRVKLDISIIRLLGVTVITSFCADYCKYSFPFADIR